jgi:hypothetical protein
MLHVDSSVVAQPSWPRLRDIDRRAPLLQVPHLEVALLPKKSPASPLADGAAPALIAIAGVCRRDLRR